MNTSGNSPTPISRLWPWLRENKEWVFSGIGITVPIALIGWLVIGPTTGGDDTGSAIVGTGIANTGAQTIPGGVEITGGDAYPPQDTTDEPGSAVAGTGIANTGEQLIEGPVTISGAPREEQP